MLYLSGLILLAIAVSLDSFGVGITYGMRKIRISWIPLILIIMCSAIMVLISMSLGKLLGSILTTNLASNIGGIILILIGIYSFYNALRPKNKEIKNPKKNNFIIFTVLKKPQDADLDNSGTISGKEAIILGIALALDAFGAGIGASLLDYSPLLTALLIASMSGLFIFFGIRSGIFLSKKKWMEKLAFIPSCLLILIGVFNLI